MITKLPQGFVRKCELALQYFPDSPNKKAATDNLTRAINRCTPLLMALANLPGGYYVREKTYSPQQIRLIYEYLGEPSSASSPVHHERATKSA